MWLPACPLPTCLPSRLSAHLPTCFLSVCLPAGLHIRLPAYSCACQPACYLSACLYADCLPAGLLCVSQLPVSLLLICLPVCVPAHCLSAYLPAPRSTCLPSSPSAWLFACWSQSTHLLPCVCMPVALVPVRTSLTCAVSSTTPYCDCLLLCKHLS